MLFHDTLYIDIDRRFNGISVGRRLDRLDQIQFRIIITELSAVCTVEHIIIGILNAPGSAIGIGTKADHITCHRGIRIFSLVFLLKMNTADILILFLQLLHFRDNVLVQFPVFLHQVITGCRIVLQNFVNIAAGNAKYIFQRILRRLKIFLVL